MLAIKATHSDGLHRAKLLRPYQQRQSLASINNADWIRKKFSYQRHCQKPFTQWVPLGSINTNLICCYYIGLY